MLSLSLPPSHLLPIILQYMASNRNVWFLLCPQLMTRLLQAPPSQVTRLQQNNLASWLEGLQEKGLCMARLMMVSIKGLTCFILSISSHQCHVPFFCLFKVVMLVELQCHEKWMHFWVIKFSVFHHELLWNIQCVLQTGQWKRWTSWTCCHNADYK